MAKNLKTIDHLKQQHYFLFIFAILRIELLIFSNFDSAFRNNRVFVHKFLFLRDSMNICAYQKQGFLKGCIFYAESHQAFIIINFTTVLKIFF